MRKLIWRNFCEKISWQKTSAISIVCSTLCTDEIWIFFSCKFAWNYTVFCFHEIFFFPHCVIWDNGIQCKFLDRPTRKSPLKQYFKILPTANQCSIGIWLGSNKLHCNTHINIIFINEWMNLFRDEILQFTSTRKEFFVM